MSLETEYAYLGRANVIRRSLRDEDEELTEPEYQAITKVQASFGDFCLDTDTTPDYITHAEGVVSLVIGTVPGLEVGLYRVKLIVFDAVTPDGLGWGSFNLIVQSAEDCGI